jgi:hypothetical protein
MKTRLLQIFLFGIIIIIPQIIFITNSYTQVTQTCSTTIANGQNLTTNGDFAAGNTGFTYTTGASGYTYFSCTPLPSSSCFSGPGNIWVGAHSDWFNQGFNLGSAGFGNTITDHSASADNNFLMVDGTCTAGNDAWAEVIPVQQNTWYYFECWVTNLNVNAASNGNASLNLNIGNSPVYTFNPPATTQGNWVHESFAWFSGANTTADLAIQNTTNTGCGTGVDFGLDDITFTPGCQYADVSTPQPLLGADGTLCGKNGAGVVLNSNVAAAAGRTFTWMNGTTTLAATTPTITVFTTGTYVVCVQNTGGCMKSDVINITATYSVSLPSTIVLCNPPSVTLDPGFSGTGVTYQWQTSSNGTTWTNIVGTLGTSQTYLANTVGYYKVTTTDPVCGTQTTNVAHVTTQETATPNNKYFCPTSTVNLSVNGTPGSTYQWYQSDGVTPVSPVTTGTSYTTPALTTATTYYVKDISTYTTSVGKTSMPVANRSGSSQFTDKAEQFTAGQSFTIDSVTVYWQLFNPGDALQIQFALTTGPSDYHTVPTTLVTGPNWTGYTNATASTAGLITPPFTTSGVYAVRVPVKITVPSAGDYRLIVASSTGNGIYETGGMSYPYNDVATGGSIASQTSSILGQNPFSATDYYSYFNWKIKYNLNCGLVPVVATPDCSQPVEFISFYAQLNAGSVGLNWVTATEKNSSYFNVEKSKDGIHFNSIGKADAAGMSTSIKNYSFTDNQLESDLVYYRLVENDIDGATTLSNVISVHSGLQNLISIVPNPNNGNFTVTIADDNNATYHLVLYNALGASVFQSIDLTDHAAYSKNIEIGTLPSGIYFLHIQAGTKRWVEKIVKQ